MKKRTVTKVHCGRVEYNKKPHFAYPLIEWEGKTVEVRPAQGFLAVYTLKGNFICHASRLITNTFGALK